MSGFAAAIAPLDRANPNLNRLSVSRVFGPGRRRKKTLFFSALLIGGQVAWLPTSLDRDNMAMAAERAGEFVKMPRDDLQKVIANALVAQVYFFPDEGKLGTERNVAAVNAIAGTQLTGEALQQVRSAMFSPQSYQGAAALQNSCSFYPRVGFRFTDGAEEAWWLVSKSCRSAILVERTDNWRKRGVVPLNLTVEALKNFIQWATKTGE